MAKGLNPLDWDLGNVPPGIAWGGVDEAGRGAWAGPVVAACAVLDPATVQRWGHVLRGARDSKQMNPDKREVLAAELKTLLPAWGIAEVDNLGIDRENILEATKQAMRQSVSSLAVKPRILFVDGDHGPRTGLLERLVVDGDALSCAIACASILAKSHRDGLLRVMEGPFPGYGFAQHKGYGTPAHRSALKMLGPCAVHRISYAPVAACLRPDAQCWAALKESLEGPQTVEDLQHWVEAALRPAYGLLKQTWVEQLRSRYAERLALLAGQGLP